jgi:hypothetical protein
VQLQGNPQGRFEFRAMQHRGSADNATLPKATVYYSADSPYPLGDLFL